MESLSSLNMSPFDVFGWLATALMLATFQCDSELWMRRFALAANVCFIVYGVAHNLLPVIILHILLLPINLRKLMNLEK